MISSLLTNGLKSTSLSLCDKSTACFSSKCRTIYLLKNIYIYLLNTYAFLASLTILPTSFSHASIVLIGNWEQKSCVYLFQPWVGFFVVSFVSFINILNSLKY